MTQPGDQELLDAHVSSLSPEGARSTRPRRVSTLRPPHGPGERLVGFVLVESPRRQVTVIGAGYVGLITAVGLVELGHAVELVEVDPARLATLRAGRAPIHEAGLPESLEAALGAGSLALADRPTDRADAVLVCVGTPIGEDGRSDLSQLRGALAALEPLAASGTPIVIRSTLPPGSTRAAVAWAGSTTSHLLTNPEFLRQGTALEDFRNPTRIVVGRFEDADPAAVALVVDLYDRLTAPILIVDVAAAELIKNGANAFLALKLSFTNEISTMAEEYGTDAADVMRGIGLDPRIGTTYMRPSFGFGGSCLPKELRALAVAGQDRGLGMHVTVAASEANAAQQHRFADRIADALGGLAGMHIGLLGLAFKAGTDDVRDSPAVALAERLLAGGATVRAYDPEAAANARRRIPELDTVDSPEAAIRDADVVVIATEWPEFAALDWEALRPLVRGALVVDGRRLLDPARVRAAGFRYEAVGTASVVGDEVTAVTS